MRCSRLPGCASLPGSCSAQTAKLGAGASPCGAGGSAPYGAANGGAGGRIGAQRDGESEAGAGAAER